MQFGSTCATTLNEMICISDKGEATKVYSSSLLVELKSKNAIEQVACGLDFAIFVDTCGNVLSCGKNESGQLGLGHFKEAQELTLVEGLPTITKVTCGGTHTLCISSERGEIWSFGSNKYGELCLKGKPNENIPKPHNSGICDIVNAACGYGFSIFEDFKGNIFACGLNNRYQLGLKNDETQFTPVPIPDVPKNISTFTCSAAGTFFLDQRGLVYACGSNFDGELGLGHSGLVVGIVQITGLPKIDVIVCGSMHTVCVSEEEDFYCFGNSRNGIHAVKGADQGRLRRKLLGTITKREKEGNIHNISRGFGHSTIIKYEDKLEAIGGDFVALLETKDYSNILGVDNSLKVSVRLKSARK